MSERIRTFIAIELDDATHRALGALQTKLKMDLGSYVVRWVAPENIHITLKFLGDVDAVKIEALERGVGEACAGVRPFDLRFGGVGAFPNLHRPNVIWVGAQGEVEIAARLAKNVEDACAALSFPREPRPFEPHLTLGRVKRDADPRERAEIAKMIAGAPSREVGACRVRGVSVMKSELKPTGSVYQRLAMIGLRQARE